MEEEPLIHGRFLLEKIQQKGGWTYIVLPGIPPDNKSPFGWRQVKGRIDSYEFDNYRLMPMGNGNLFLPVKAEVRKKIGKKEGDWVTLALYIDDQPTAIPEELSLCLQEDPVAHQTFFSFTDSERRAYINWINSAKREETKVNRIAKTLNKLARGKKFLDQDK